LDFSKNPSLKTITMKSKVKFILIVLILGINSAHAKFSMSLPFGTHERIVKVRDLPDTPQFQLKDDTYYDIGSMYEIKNVFGLSYSNTTAEYIGFIGGQEKYVALTPEELNAIIATTRIKIPEEAKITFFDRFVSKPLLLLIFIVMGFFSRKYFLEYRRQPALKTEEDMLPWPPKQVHE
jgi:hypothetical protein